MKTPIALAALTLALLACDRADAQVFGTLSGPPTVVYSSSYGPPGSRPGGIYPYSYYAAFPGPARGYVGYGADPFPFYGDPYGHVYDRWTWSSMGGYPSALDRYYYPPVR